MLVAVEVPQCTLRFGEHLRLVGSCEELGSWDTAAAPMLEWGEGDNWAAEVALPFGEHAFKLVIMRSDGSQYWEEGENRQLAVVATAPSAAPALRVVALFGKTADTAVQNMALTKDAAGDTSKGVARPMQGQFGTINPFKPGAVGSRLTIAAPQVSRRRTDAVRTAAAATTAQSTSTTLVAVEVPQCTLRFGEHLRLVGSCEELGSWDTAAAPMLEWGEGDNWAAEVALPSGEHAFKLVIMRSDGSQYWEEGENRQLAVVATAPSAAPALRVVALFGKTADTAVAQPPIEAESYAALDDITRARSASDAVAPAEDRAVATEIDGCSSATSSVVDVKVGNKASAATAGVSAVSRSSAAQRDAADRQQKSAQELAEAWRRSKVGTLATSEAAPAAKQGAATTVLSSSLKGPQPAQTAASMAAAAPASAAVASAAEPSSGFVLPMLLPLCAGILCLGAAALSVLPGLELSSGNAVDGSTWTSAAAAAVAAMQHTLASLFAAFQSGSAEASHSAAESMWALQTAAGDGLGSLQASATSGWAAVQANAGASGLSRSAAHAFVELQREGQDLLGSLAATSSDVLVNVKTGSGTLQAGLVDRVSSLEASGNAALSNAQAASAEVVSETVSSLQKSLAALHF